MSEVPGNIQSLSRNMIDRDHVPRHYNGPAVDHQPLIVHADLFTALAL